MTGHEPRKINLSSSKPAGVATIKVFSPRRLRTHSAAALPPTHPASQRPPIHAGAKLHATTTPQCVRFPTARTPARRSRGTISRRPTRTLQQRSKRAQAAAEAATLHQQAAVALERVVRLCGPRLSPHQRSAARSGTAPQAALAKRGAKTPHVPAAAVLRNAAAGHTTVARASASLDPQRALPAADQSSTD